MARLTKSVWLVCLVSVPCLAGLVQGGNVAALDGWQLSRMTAAGPIYHREIEGSGIPEAMIVTTFDATPEQVHRVVVDYAHFAAFIPNIVQSKVLAKAGVDQWVYHHLKFAGPIADRAYVIRSTDRSSQTRQTSYRVDWALDDRRFPDIDLSSHIRPDAFSGFWELRSVAGSSTTEARYGVHSDPGGLVPGWLVGKMTDRYMQQVVDAIRERLAEQ